VPLLATAIRKAERTALAMDSRAFGAFETRTYFCQVALAPHDWLFVIAFWGLSLALIFALAKAGLLGSLVLLQDF
jgi:energy-coupling factor transport system permease protein